jgi:hypothetical protein
VHYLNGISIRLTEILLGYMALVAGICITTLIICVILDIIKSFVNDNIRDRILIIVLLIIFTLKAIMEFLRSS